MSAAVVPVSSRLVTLDLVRGYCVLLITVTHLAANPSLLDPFTTRGVLWISAAEVFMFVSGFLVGQVRGKQARAGAWRGVCNSVWRRAATLYVAILAMTAVLALAKLALRSTGVVVPTQTSNGAEDLQVLLTSLRLGQDGTDILISYTVLLLLTQAVLLLLTRGLWSVVLVGALSVFLVADPGDWHLLYGVSFFGGVVVGFHRTQVEVRWASAPHWVRPALVVTGLATLTFSFAVDLAPVLGSERLRSTDGLAGSAAYQLLLQDERGGALRPVVLALWMGAAFVLVHRYEDRLVRWSGPVLLPLGRAPLYAYLLQVPIVAVLRILPVERGVLANTLLGTAAVVCLWVAVRLRVLSRVLPS